MRRVDSDGDSRGFRGQKRAEAGSRSRLRRAAIEWLESRELLSTSTSTLPTPTVLTDANLGTGPSTATAGQALTGGPSANTPSVAVDPIDPMKMVAVWVDHDPVGYNGGNFTAPITSYIEGAFSTDGGTAWNPLPAAAFGTGGFVRNNASVNVQQDFSVTPSTSTIAVFTQTTSPTIAFDRNENVYILSSTHDDSNDAGVLDLQRFSFVGANNPTYNGFTPVYSWDMPDSAAKSGTVDQAVTPSLAVDTNLPSFTDPSTGTVQTDPFSGNLYAVWAEIDSNTYGGIPNFNADTIVMASSSDQGLFFTPPAFVDDSSNANGHNIAVVTNPPPPENILHDSNARYVEPQVTVSQGNPTTGVAGGQVTIVYDDYGTEEAHKLDQIDVQTNTLGGTSAQFSSPAGDLGINTFASVNSVVVAENFFTPIPVNVNITDPKFTSLEDFNVNTSIVFDTNADLEAVLIRRRRSTPI